MGVMHLRFIVVSAVLVGCVPLQYGQSYYQPPPAAPAPAPAVQPAPAPAAAPGAPVAGAPIAPPDPAAAPPAAPAPAAPVTQVAPPYAAQPYPPPAAPYPPPAAPYPYSPAAVEYHSVVHSGEVIADFAIVGGLVSTDILIKDSFANNSANTFLVLAGIGAGGGLGYLLTEKYPVDAAVARSTTTGLLLGVANGALLIQPTGANDAASVMGLIVAGSALGAAGGFIYGENTHLTSGQMLFVENMILLGAATSLISISIQNTYGSAENTSMLLGIDGAAVLGAVLAPGIKWSPHRARLVFAGTLIGAFLGGSIVALATNQQNQTNGGDANVLAGRPASPPGCGVASACRSWMTKDELNDPRYAPVPMPGAAPPTIAPWAGPQGARSG